MGVVRNRTKNQISAGELLKRINSSCSSGRERRKSVVGLRTINMAADKVIWKW